MLGPLRARDEGSAVLGMACDHVANIPAFRVAELSSQSAKLAGGHERIGEARVDRIGGAHAFAGEAEIDAGLPRRMRQQPCAADIGDETDACFRHGEPGALRDDAMARHDRRGRCRRP